jgi:hypothetical protein
MPDLELVAFGVMQAGVEIIVADQELDPDDLLAALIEVVCRKTGVRSEEAHAAILRATAKMRDQSCN